MTSDGIVAAAPLNSPSTDNSCTHCGLPVPAGLLVPEREEQFCCRGCETVFGILNREGLCEIYDETRIERKEPARAERSYALFDEPSFIDLHTRELEGGYRQIELYVESVHCAACVWLLEKLPQMIPGVREARLNYPRSMLSVTWNTESVTASHIGRLLDRLGYPPHPYRDLNREAAERREDRRMLIRIAVAGAVAGNVMLIAFALYGGTFEGMTAHWRNLFRWFSLLLTIPSVFWAGNIFFKRALAGLRARTLHMDLPIAIGVGAGFIWGVVNTVTASGEVYFDSVTVLIFLLLCGRWLQRRQQRRALQATELLYNLAPATARRIDPQSQDVREVPLEALQPGDRIEVRAGDTIAADGAVLGGSSDLDLSVLTGESRPVAVVDGDLVHAGTLNLTSRLEIGVTATGTATRIGRLLREVEESAQRRAPVVRLVDRISGVFVAVVLMLALFTAVLWYFLDPTQAIEHSVALLIVCCPCALGLATPLAITVGLGHAARAGILVKGGDTLEALARPGTLFLDKTGTLTVGRLELVEWIGDGAIKPLVRALESQSSHPIARALCRSLPEQPGLQVDSVKQTLGRGIVGRVDGRQLVVGSCDYVSVEVGIPGPELVRAAARLAEGAFTPVAIAVDGEVLAIAGIGDPLRPEAPQLLEQLTRDGWRPAILSGDHPAVVAEVARRLKLDQQVCFGAQSPEDKLLAVEKAAELGTVVMVGDGVNDAAALSAATVGIGVHGGAEASLAVADIFFTRPGLGVLRDLFQGAGRTMRVIRRNLGVSLVYNLIGAGLAITGVISPVLAAILMPFSSLSVVWSSYHSQTFEK